MPRHKAVKPSSPAPEGAANEWERFVARRISRDQISNAPYNPRQIAPAARKLLMSNLEKVGLIEPIVWNVRTGNIVGGHQRLSILDDLHGEGKPYKLTVSEVDLDLTEEKTQNVFLNNPAAQGTFSQELMADLLGDEQFMAGGGLEAAGFTPFDFEMEFGFRPDIMAQRSEVRVESESSEGDSQESSGETQDDVESMGPTSDQTDLSEGLFGASKGEDRNSAEAMKKRKAEYEATSSADPMNDTDYMIMISFDTRDAKNAFLKNAGLRLDLRYMSSADLREMLNEAFQWPM